MLIGRITANDFTATSMNVQFVAIHKDVKINSGADAERAFNAKIDEIKSRLAAPDIVYEDELALYVNSLSEDSANQ